MSQHTRGKVNIPKWFEYSAHICRPFGFYAPAKGRGRKKKVCLAYCVRDYAPCGGGFHSVWTRTLLIGKWQGGKKIWQTAHKLWTQSTKKARSPPATYVPVQLLSFLIHIYEEEWKKIDCWERESWCWLISLLCNDEQPSVPSFLFDPRELFSRKIAPVLFSPLLLSVMDMCVDCASDRRYVY